MSQKTTKGGRAGIPALPRAAILLALTYLGFVSLGLPDASYGVAWPSLSATFGLGPSAFGLGLLFVGIGYLCSSLMAGSALRRFGAGRLLATSTLVTCLGLTGFALSPSFEFFLAAGLLAGLGGGAIDAGLNAYAADHYSARQMNWLHAAFGLGAALGPLSMTAALSFGEWRLGYGLIAAAMALLALLFFATQRLWRDDAGVAAGASTFEGVSMRQAAGSGLVWLQTSTFFVYGGVEVATGQWAFAILTLGRDYTVEAAGLWTGGFWFALFAGRLLLGFGADAIGPDRLIALGAATAFVALAVFALDPFGLGTLGLVTSGFAMAPIFPMLMHRTPRLLGRGLAAHSIGFQVSAAMIGGVAVPAAAGLLAAVAGLGAVAYLLAGAAALHLGLAWIGLRRPPAHIGVGTT